MLRAAVNRCLLLVKFLIVLVLWNLFSVKRYFKKLDTEKATCFSEIASFILSIALNNLTI